MPAEAFSRLDIPVLYMTGASSPESARAVARVLVPYLPRVRVETLPGTGHRAPVTRPDRVDAVIIDFLARLAD